MDGPNRPGRIDLTGGLHVAAPPAAGPVGPVGQPPTELAHDVRTPLAGMLGLGELLLGTRLDARQHQYAAALHRSAAALLRLVDGWLDLAQLDAGAVELESADFELDALVGEVLDLLAPQATAQGIALGASFEAGCPRRLRGDGLRLRQVLANLVGNAVKFTARGSVEVVLAAADAGAGRVRLRVQVRDTGIGIDPHARRRLFRPFSQADASVARRYGGNGLGLALSQRLVERMDGRIGVDSEPGRGSTFWFTALLAAADAAQGAAAPYPRARRIGLRTLPAGRLPDGLPIGQAGGDSAPATGGATRRVLVAEDDPAGQMVAAPLLRQAGFEASVVGDGAEAFEAVRRGRCDLVLMDLRLPTMDGLEATRRIRALGGAAARMPVVGMTAARAMQAERARCLAAGMDDCIAKPLDAAALAAVLGRWLPAQVLPVQERPMQTMPGQMLPAQVLPAQAPSAQAAGIEEKTAGTGTPPSGLETRPAETGPPTADAAAGGQPDASAPAPEAPLLDAAQLDGLRTAFTPAQWGEIVRVGLRSCRACVGRLRDLADADDAARLSHAAHDLCGTAGTLGAVRLARHAAELERACERVDMGRARRLVTAIERDARPTWAALRVRAGKPSGLATPN